MALFMFMLHLGHSYVCVLFFVCHICKSIRLVLFKYTFMGVFFSGTSFQKAFAAAAMRGSLMSEICTKNVTWQPTLAILRLGYQHMHLFTLQAKWSMSCAAMLQRRSELTSLGRMKLFLICHMCIKDNTL